MDTIKWDCPKEESELITKIVRRVSAELDKNADIVSTCMDIMAVHLNDVPLDLEKLLKADKANLGHDVFGISGHINRETGKLTRGFLPRCVKGI